MIFRPLIAVVICFISMAGIAQNPRKVCEVYETEAFGLSTNGADGEFLVPARLVVRPAELNGGVTSITLELVSPTTASLIRLTKYSLPPAYESLLAEQDELLLETGVTGYSGSSTHFDITAMASRKGSSAPAYVVTVLNALGEPAAGVRLEIKAGMFDKSVSLGMQSVPADGRVRLKIPQPPDSNGRVPPNSLFYRPFSTLSILATDQSGQRQQLQFPSVVEPGEAANFETLELAFLPRETTAPAYRGKVLGPDGQPSPGTRMVSYWLQTPGMGGSQMYGNASTIYPAPDGTFCFGVPQNLLQFKLGVRDLPASSTLRVKIAGLPGVDLRTDRENVIQLPQMETIRVQLMGSDGAPLSGLKAGYSINVTAESKGQPDAKARTSITPTARLTDAANAVVSLDSIAVPHQYTFTINDVSYEPVFLDKGAGSQLVQLHPNMSRAEVTGTVLAADIDGPWIPTMRS